MSNFPRGEAAYVPQGQRRKSGVGEDSAEHNPNVPKTKAVWRPKVRQKVIKGQSVCVSSPKADLFGLQRETNADSSGAGSFSSTSTKDSFSGGVVEIAVCYSSQLTNPAESTAEITDSVSAHEKERKGTVSFWQRKVARADRHNTFDSLVTDAMANNMAETMEDAMDDVMADAIADTIADEMADAMADAIADEMANKMADAIADKMADASVDKMADTMVDTMMDEMLDTIADSMEDTSSFDSHIQRQMQPQDPFLLERTLRMDVSAYGSNISVIVTSDAAVAHEWLRSQQSHMFGMDLEWRPNRYRGQDNKVALLQLCSQRECLMLQMLFLDEIPQGLVSFLLDFEKKIAGVGVKEDAKKLYRDYGLQCNGLVELTVLAIQKLGKSICKKMGLKSLAKEVIGLKIEKPKRITMSDWARPFLDMRQIEYACIDAWASFAIFEKLMTTSNQAQAPARACHQPAS